MPRILAAATNPYRLMFAIAALLGLRAGEVLGLRSKKRHRCSSGPYCSRWFLHKFRHTYASRHLQDGIDIRILQLWMGHRDIASTMVYLKGVRNRDIQARLNKGSLGSLAAFA